MGKFICKATSTEPVRVETLPISELLPIEVHPQEPTYRPSLRDYWQTAEPAERIYIVSAFAQIVSMVLLLAMIIMQLKKN